MSIKTQLNDLGHSFDNRSSAEKVLIAFGIVAALAWLFFILVWEPETNAIQQLQQQVSTTESRLAAMQQRETIAATMGNEDPNMAVRQRIERAIADQARMQSRIEELAGNLVTPQSMTRLLTSMLEDRSGLTLVRVENSPPQPMRPVETVVDPASPEEAATVLANTGHQQVYKHSLLLELEGDYLSLINYLRRVESFSERFFWDEIGFQQTTWPNARITLQLHTLSAEEGFVGV